MVWILPLQTLKPQSLPHQGVLSHVRGHLTRFFFSDWSCLIKLSPETDCVFSHIFFFTKGRNYTYISITLDVHFSWYTFPMSSHNELRFFLKDCFNYWNIQQINCISKMQIEGKSLKNAGTVVPCSYAPPILAIFTATLFWIGSQKTPVKLFFPQLRFFSPQLRYFLLFYPQLH